MIDNGATLTWEEWDGERSQLHNCYNSIGSWFIQALAGIVPDADAPGYRHFYVRPQPVQGVDWAQASVDTPRGTARVKWERTASGLSVEVDVPVGSTATLCLPDGEEVQLASGHHRIG
jgi:alpha-L-rhamnosidase